MTIKEVIMKRDGITEEEADERIDEAQMEFDEYMEDGDTISAEDICMVHFGLEPDYLVEFMEV